MPLSIWETIDLIDFAEDRILPVAGGVLDQTSAFMDAREIFRTASTLLKRQKPCG